MVTIALTANTFTSKANVKAEANQMLYRVSSYIGTGEHADVTTDQQQQQRWDITWQMPRCQRQALPEFIYAK